MESWRIFGTDFLYVSHAGSDAAGTTGGPNDPFRTLLAVIQAAEARISIANPTIVIGAGFYAEDLTFNRTNMNYQFQADGRVVLTGMNTGGALIHSANILLSVYFNGIEFESIGSFFAGTGSGPGVYGFSNCIFRDVVLDIGVIGTFSNNIFITSVIYGGPELTLTRNSFFGSNIGISSQNQFILSCTNNFFDGNTRLIRLFEPGLGILDYNNYDFGAGCTVQYYDGVNLSAHFNTLADVQNYSNVWNQNSLGLSPAFNGFSPEDYTLTPGSPLAYSASDGKQIGTYGIAVSEGTQSGQAFHSASPGFASSNVTFNGSGWVLSPNQSVGTITSGFIDLGAFQTVDIIRLFATQFSPGDVVDTDNTADNPNRQTYELSWGPDSGNMGPFILMEWEKHPQLI